MRRAGILLHPTSLPGPYGIGDVGPEAHHWVDLLADSRQSIWQILPLNPTGAGDSPYSSYSAFAGNTLLLSPDFLVRDGLVLREFVELARRPPTASVDFATVTNFKKALLREAWNRFRGGGAAWLQGDFERYCHEESAWLQDFALFAALREAFGGKGLSEWPEEVQRRHPVAIGALENKLAAEVAMHRFGQYLFDRQWAELKSHAHNRGIQILGDIPIFVADDSADRWAKPDYFLLDEQGERKALAGVPPDYFSADGQLWGNPLYDWDRHANDGYAWWIARVRRVLSHADLLRIDHFRGFAAAWHVEPGATTARNGRWVNGPGGNLFDALRNAIGSLPFIAEDLGIITPDVAELRDRYQLPGMKILQFMIGGADNPYWPHNHLPNAVVATGTHDNDTTCGWYAGLDDGARRLLARYLGHEIERPAREFLRLALASPARLAIVPLQDILELGSQARMNVPGVAGGNWRWRAASEQLRHETFHQLAEWTSLYGRG